MSSSNDESEIVCSQFRVVVRSVRICEASRCQNSAALNTGLKSLLAKSQLLQLLQSILLRSTVEDSILQDRTLRSVDEGFVGCISITTVLKVPAVSSLVVLETRVVVTLVEILENRGKDLGLFVR